MKCVCWKFNGKKTLLDLNEAETLIFSELLKEHLNK